ncbi:MAG: MFS transporter [Alphaproteobacteria bacterium]|nr:MFS transporter [Alphaproteobacteria bacterium]
MTALPAAPRFSAWGYREFRLLWTAQLAADLAANMQLFAINWHVFELLVGSTLPVSLLGFRFELSGAAAGLGGMGLARLLPIVVFGISGGILADALDRRRLMMWTRLCVFLVAAVLALATALGGASVALLYLISAAGAALSGFDTPARQSMVPATVPASHLSHAISLFALAFRLSAIAAPLAGAFLIEAWSIAAAYWVIAASFAVPALCLAAMRLSRPDDAIRAQPSLAAFAEGARFVRGTPMLWSTYLLDFFASCFATVGVLLPILAEVVFDSGVQGYGLLAAGQPLGAVATSLVLAWWHRLRWQGPLLIACVGLYGTALAIVGVSRSIWLSFAMLALFGAADTVSTVIRATLRQVLTPDHLRGRVASIALIFFRGGPRIGELQAGMTAAVLGAPFAIMLGGLATVACTALVVWRFPQLRGYDTVADARAGGRQVAR